MSPHAFEIFTAGIDRWWPKHLPIGENPVKRAIIDWAGTLSMKAARWAPAAKRFTPKEEGTQVELEHHKFECMPRMAAPGCEALQWGNLWGISR